MSSSMSQREEAVLETIIPQLEADGYQVFIHPSRMMLPTFLNAVVPDAVAYKGDSKIAIEVMADGASEGAKYQRMQAAFAGHPDWELRLVYAPSRDSGDSIPVASPDTIEEHLKRIESSLDVMGYPAALLTAWAVFEAAGRSLIPDHFSKAQTPGRLLEALASEGYVTPDEADLLRQIAKVRTEVAHGRLDLIPAHNMVESLIDITRSILRPDG